MLGDDLKYGSVDPLEHFLGQLPEIVLELVLEDAGGEDQDVLVSFVV